MTDKEAMKLALDALTYKKWFCLGMGKPNDPRLEAAITALKARLAQEKALQALHEQNERLGLYEDAYAEQEPAAQYSDIVSDGGFDPRNKFDAQPQRTEQEPICPKCEAKVLYECVACSSNNYPPPKRTEPPQKKVWTFWDLSGGDITDAIKAKLKEKNT
jgi:hypothetical protein